jgi:thiamine pyrophosphate-dependent acetolactate synthase large subunit-like protein
VTGRPLAVAVHSNVGLFHATMAIFRAWCDRMAVVVSGATGPVDAAKRRPWFDWIHTARDQGALVRGYVKWDDQPASPAAAREALLRAAWLAQAAPQAPVYVNLDAGMQEEPLAEALPPLDAARFRPPAHAIPAATEVQAAAELLAGAKSPLLLIGRVSRSVDAWNARVALAERLPARVLTDLKVGAAFPTAHPLHAAPPSVLTSAAMVKAIASADVILSLDWVDLGGTLRTALGADVRARIVHVSLDHTLHNGWSMDHQALPPADVMLAADPDAAVPLLLAALPAKRATATRSDAASPADTHADAVASPPATPADVLDTDALARALRRVVGSRPISFLHLPLSWSGEAWPLAHPLDFLGSDGGGGIGGGPGIAVGAALALRDSGRLPVAICGDGDYLMGVTALWTAAHYRIPLLVIVANNRTFFNDEVHQERMARVRGRPVANKWIGQRMSDPDIDLAQMAEAQGALGIGPVMRSDGLEDAFTRAIAAVEAGRVAVVDVHVIPGYTPAMSAVTGAGAKPHGR